MEIEYKKLYKNLPQIVKKILIVSDGWLVGSTIDNILNDKICTDYDILITDVNLYNKILIFFNKDNIHSINTFYQYIWWNKIIY